MDSRYLEIVRLLINAAPFVFTQECFALKGGTAINLFLEDMPRLSVDIDLVYTHLDHSDRVSALAAIEKSLHAVAELLESKLGVTVRPTTSGSEHESKLFISRGPVLLKVEVNHVFRGTVYPLVVGTMSALAQKRFSRALSVPMLDPDEVYASKLVAAMDRQHPRALFDVMLLLEGGGITPRMRRAFTVYLAGHNRPIHELLSPNSKDIKTEFESDFIGMASREVSLEQLENVRERIFRELPVSLDAAERSFLLSVNRCEPDWEILGLTGIESLPAIKWKLLNLGKLARANPKKYEMILKSLEEKFRGDA
jgi:predicted nucleotidyltransferase component of viral defense system